MNESTVRDITVYKHCSNCNSVATKEVRTRDMPQGLISKYYCPVCFDEWKNDQGTTEENMQWAREKLISKGMSEEEVDTFLKEAYKK